MKAKLAKWIEITNGFAIGTALDVGLAVGLAAVATTSLRYLFESF
jgi:hypothetical protein